MNDLSEILDSTISSHQYADDTSLYTHCKPADLKSYQDKLQSTLDKLSNWSNSNNLVLNPKNPKVMLFSTTQLFRVHRLEERSVHLVANGVELKRINSSLLLGTMLQQNVKWNEDISRKISSCHGTLSILKKLKHRSCSISDEKKNSLQNVWFYPKSTTMMLCLDVSLTTW